MTLGREGVVNNSEGQNGLHHEYQLQTLLQHEKFHKEPLHLQQLLNTM